MTCKYYKNLDGHSGECFLNPPIKSQGVGTWLHPIVNSDNFCSHFTKNPEEKIVKNPEEKIVKNPEEKIVKNPEEKIVKVTRKRKNNTMP